MKRFLTLMLALSVILACGCCRTALASAFHSGSDEEAYLSPDNKCPVQPTIYCSPRYLNPDNNTGYNLKSGLSAKQIDNPSDGRQYGLYFKFTPKGRHNGYHISRFDVIVSDRTGTELYRVGFDADMDCQTGYYWYWNFFPLNGLFENMRSMYGSVITGRFTMDIYFNSLWAGRTAFTIKK